MNPAINSAMRNMLLDTIARERAGETIDRTRVKDVSRMLMQLGSEDDPWDIYNTVRPLKMRPQELSSSPPPLTFIRLSLAEPGPALSCTGNAALPNRAAAPHVDAGMLW